MPRKRKPEGPTVNASGNVPVGWYLPPAVLEAVRVKAEKDSRTQSKTVEILLRRALGMVGI